MHLTVKGLAVTFNTSEGKVIPALESVATGVAAGSFVAILGPSGSGKSTLVRVVAGLQKPSAGQVLADGVPITDPHPKIALMFQEATLMPWRTVRDNIALPLELAGVAQKDRYKQVAALLPALGLADFASAYPGELSGGMAQRAALGRVLIQRPEVLLLDEPFGALDALTRETISLDLLKLWAEYRPTVLMVTHDINEAVLMADRVLVLSQRPGRIISDVTVPLARPRTLDMIYTAPFIATAKQLRAAINRA